MKCETLPYVNCCNKAQSSDGKTFPLFFFSFIVVSYEAKHTPTHMQISITYLAIRKSKISTKDSGIACVPYVSKRFRFFLLLSLHDSDPIVNIKTTSDLHFFLSLLQPRQLQTIPLNGEHPWSGRGRESGEQ